MPTAFSAPDSSHAGSSDLKKIRGRPISEQGPGVADAPPHAEARGGLAVAAVGRDQGGDRDEVVRVGGVPQAQRQGDPERDQQGCAAEQAGQPGIDLLKRMKQNLEVHPDPLQLGRIRRISRGLGNPLREVTGGGSLPLGRIVPLRPHPAPPCAVSTMPRPRISEGRERRQQRRPRAAGPAAGSRRPPRRACRARSRARGP